MENRTILFDAHQIMGARETLRLEAGMNLYGSDMDESILLLETGLI